MAQAAAEHGDGSALRSKRRLVGSGVDPPRKTAVNGESRIGQLIAELFGGLRGVMTGAAGAHNPDAVAQVALLESAQHVEDDRGIVDLLEQGRVFRVVPGEDSGAGSGNEFQLSRRIGMLLPGGDDGGDLRADALHTKERLPACPQHLRRTSETLQQAPESYRADLRKHVQHNGCLDVGHWWWARGFQAKAAGRTGRAEHRP